MQYFKRKKCRHVKEVVFLAKRLTDKQKKKIVADYAECENYSEVARKHNVSFTTVKRVVNNDPELVRKVEQKKEQNAEDILSFMESKKQNVNNIISRYLDALLDETKIERSSPQALATALGIIIDKFTMTSQKQSDVTLFATIAQAAGGFKHGA